MTESAEFLRILNNQRTSRGLQPLVVDPLLQRIAESKVSAIIKHNEFSHTVDGETEGQLRARYGYPIKARQDEVICWSEATGLDALCSFFGSKVHRNVLLDRGYRYIGIAGPVGSVGRDPLWGTWAVEIGDLPGKEVFTSNPAKPGAEQPKEANDQAPNQPIPKKSEPAHTVSTPVATSGKITRKTPFRQIGPVPFDVFSSVLRGANSPVSPLDEVFRIAGNDSALLLTQMARESSYGTSQLAASTKNSLGLKLPDNSGFCSYGCWSTAVAEWRYRIHSKTYKDGVYFPTSVANPDLLSIEDYLTIYVGGPGCLSSGMKTCGNGETAASINAYIDKVVAQLNTYFDSPAPAPDGKLTFGLVPNPGIINRIIPGTVGGGAWVPVGNNSAWDNLGKRSFKGICLHIMEGTLDGTDAYFRNEARSSAFTDFGVGIVGSKGSEGIYQWNALSEGRAPWASGPANDMEGDGPAFYSKYGVNAINRDLRSIEIAGYAGQSVPDARIQKVVELMAYLADQAGIAWDKWPFMNGLTLVYGHFEFGPKTCPGSYIINLIPEIIERVRAILKKYQEF